MTTVKIRTGNGDVVAAVDQSLEEIFALAGSVRENQTMSYSTRGAKGELVEDVIYYEGGEVYVGTGPSLSWEYSMQIGPHVRLFSAI